APPRASISTTPSEPAPPPPPVPVAPTPSPIESSPPPPPPPAPIAHHHWYQDKIGDALVVVGAGAFIGGLIEYHAATSDLDDAEHAPSISGYDSKVSSAHGARTVSVVLGVGG